MHQTLQIITLALISLPLIFIISLSLVCTAQEKGIQKKKRKKPHKQISHLTWKSQDLIDLNAHGSEYDNFNINEQMSSFIMHAI